MKTSIRWLSIGLLLCLLHRTACQLSTLGDGEGANTVQLVLPKRFRSGGGQALFKSPFSEAEVAVPDWSNVGKLAEQASVFSDFGPVAKLTGGVGVPDLSKLGGSLFCKFGAMKNHTACSPNTGAGLVNSALADKLAKHSFVPALPEELADNLVNPVSVEELKSGSQELAEKLKSTLQDHSIVSGLLNSSLVGGLPHNPQELADALAENVALNNSVMGELMEKIGALGIANHSLVAKLNASELEKLLHPVPNQSFIQWGGLEPPVGGLINHSLVGDLADASEELANKLKNPLHNYSLVAGVTNMTKALALELKEIGYFSDAEIDGLLSKVHGKSGNVTNMTWFWDDILEALEGSGVSNVHEELDGLLGTVFKHAVDGVDAFNDIRRWLKLRLDGLTEKEREFFLADLTGLIEKAVWGQDDLQRLWNTLLEFMTNQSAVGWPFTNVLEDTLDLSQVKASTNNVGRIIHDVLSELSSADRVTFIKDLASKIGSLSWNAEELDRLWSGLHAYLEGRGEGARFVEFVEKLLGGHDGDAAPEFIETLVELLANARIHWHSTTEAPGTTAFTTTSSVETPSTEMPTSSTDVPSTTEAPSTSSTEVPSNSTTEVPSIAPATLSSTTELPRLSTTTLAGPFITLMPDVLFLTGLGSTSTEVPGGEGGAPTGLSTTEAPHPATATPNFSSLSTVPPSPCSGSGKHPCKKAKLKPSGWWRDGASS